MKRLLLVLTTTAALSLLPVRVYALCTLPGMEVAMVDYTVATKVATIFLRPSSTDWAIFRATTTDPNVIGAAENAVHFQTKVLVQGNAVNCPVSGAIGNVVFLRTGW